MLSYRQGQLYAEDVSLQSIGDVYGTPTYVYSKTKIVENVTSLEKALSSMDYRICYPVKCNFSLGILDLLHRLGLSFDVASEGELRRLISLGVDVSDVVFTGVGKSKEEIELALAVGIGCFHVESEQELLRIESIAKRSKRQAPVAFRINPNVATATHNYIATGTWATKFGIPIEQAEELYLYAEASQHLSIKGIHCHIGSQITSVDPYVQARDILLSLVDRLLKKGIKLQFFDIGGGFGIRYKETDSIANWNEWFREYAEPIASRGLKLLLEPGRLLMGDAGVLLTKVEYIKKMPEKNFAIVNAAMNDLMFPTLFDGYFEILNVTQKSKKEEMLFDIVGPLCESSDFLGLDRQLSIAQDDFLVIASTAAYGSAFCSNFSSRVRAAEVMVDKDGMWIIKERETFEFLRRTERGLLSHVA